jgi:peptidoglycan hydrolase-like protein with peptidoglycan-binding domain
MTKINISYIAVSLCIATASCLAQGYDFNDNLKAGDSGSGVVALQEALISSGFHIPAIETGNIAEGYFGNQTLAAVKLYQTAHNIPNTGFVGPLTRTSLNERSVSKSNGDSAPSVNGTIWSIGSSQTISWTPDPFRGFQVSITLVPETQPTCPAGTPCGAEQEYTITPETNDTGSYQWTVGSVEDDYGVALTPGTYQIMICSLKSGTMCANDIFTMATGTTSH